jgi:type IV secretion system protein VirB1
MPLGLAALLALAPACAPDVAPRTLLAVARVESGFDPLAIGVNGAPPIRVKARSVPEATAAARALLVAGRDIDLGLGQINVRNLAPLGLDLDSAFDPCRNLAASARVLQAGYRRAAPDAGGEQAALRTALSFYNTGRPDLGVRNGYVAKVVRAAATLVPALDPADRAAPPAPPAGARPAWSVFGAAPSPGATSFVLSPSSGDRP